MKTEGLKRMEEFSELVKNDCYEGKDWLIDDDGLAVERRHVLGNSPIST